MACAALAAIQGQGADAGKLGNPKFGPGAATATASTGQHPDVHIGGFHLRSIFVHSAAERGLVRRSLRFDDNPHVRDVDELQRRSRRSLPTISASENSRDRVLTLLKLNVLAYPDGIVPKALSMKGYYEATLADVIAAGDGLFNTSSWAADKAAMQVLYATIQAEVKATAGATYKYDYRPEKAAEFDTGVAALEFVRGSMKVYVFRGSYSTGDFNHIQNWVIDWVLEKMTGRLKEAWTVDAKLPWTSVQQQREGISDTMHVEAFKIGTWVSNAFLSAFASTFSGAVGEAQAKNESGVQGLTVSKDSAGQTGYWDVTKKICDELSSESGDNLILTGHSQGGTRAQLCSMYLKKKHSKTRTTVSFAATGAACFPRLMWSDSNLLDDVDPAAAHTQITDYAHPLDPWGNALGWDVGNKCLYGVGDTTSSAYKYCAKVYGYSGPYLMWAHSGKGLPPPVDSGVKAAFSQCRYFTHLVEAQYLAMSAAGVVNADGTMGQAGTCAAVPPLKDSECPDGSVGEDMTALAIVVVVVVVSLCGCCILAFLLFKSCCQSGDNDSPVEPMY